jgi:hypothetical protein
MAGDPAAGLLFIGAGPAHAHARKNEERRSLFQEKHPITSVICPLLIASGVRPYPGTKEAHSGAKLRLV